MTTYQQTREWMAEIGRKSNEVRTSRAAVKRRIADVPTSLGSRRLAASLLRQLPEEAESLAVGEFVMSCRRMGRSKMVRVIRCVPVSESRKLRDLTDRERDALAVLLESQGSRGSA